MSLPVESGRVLSRAGELPREHLPQGFSQRLQFLSHNPVMVSVSPRRLGSQAARHLWLRPNSLAGGQGTQRRQCCATTLIGPQSFERMRSVTHTPVLSLLFTLSFIFPPVSVIIHSHNSRIPWEHYCPAEDSFCVTPPSRGFGAF